MLPSLHRRVGFWLDELDWRVFHQLTARLVSENVIVADCRGNRVGNRWHVRIGLIRKDEGFDIKCFPRTADNQPSGKVLTFRVHKRQKRVTIAGLPPMLAWRLCKDRRWHVKRFETYSGEAVAGFSC